MILQSFGYVIFITIFEKWIFHLIVHGFERSKVPIKLLSLFYYPKRRKKISNWRVIMTILQSLEYWIPKPLPQLSVNLCIYSIIISQFVYQYKPILKHVHYQNLISLKVRVSSQHTFQASRSFLFCQVRSNWWYYSHLGT